ncbi:hypothetical protein ZYGR_0N04900 [Zygosaccharomyces rouxii]|uniref:Mannosyltransferase n=2 Tax=Zygosaccharomyces rouxii TaxID=4956 RepID=C5DW33_ZYGRC|nr:uncharacterized protein ZYRO0D11550g [Zygosaccharomyces rouxii]KAH9200912.1 Alg9-like mannosyltransferase family-domain-containing protein [Zygosaccharomyces rouxii]GAV49085.1 hypothetical protein ZYGR_0N04900 [Zygosaccharomyces rouxii]CAR28002.1 ZYRO0D11550p [Zygosaccharomyces rouxii]
MNIDPLKSMKWLIWALIGVFIALQPSYIHPDEHFQSLEVLATRIGGVKGSIPWEFTQDHSARSFVPLYISHWWVFQFYGILSPLWILRLVRLQNFGLYLLISRYALNHLTHSGSQAEFLLQSSYIAWCHQSHSFSNSLETLLVLIALSLYSDLTKVPNGHHAMVKSAVLSIVITLGVFNRITFPVFLLIPSVVLFVKFYLRSWRSLMVLGITILLSALSFIYVDTLIYGGSRWVIAPWNNFKYNLDESNLAQHGLHPRYTHVLVNFPQLVGPTVLFLQIPRKSLRGWFTNIPVLSALSGLALLSVFKHQELRFLIPLAPLTLMSLKFNSYWKTYGVKAWIGFNIIMATVMGVLHQGGIVPLLDLIRDEPVGVHIWWKTYSPPTWMYANQRLITSTTNFVDNVERVDNVPFSSIHDHVVDLKGCDETLLNHTLHQFLLQNTNVQIIAPNSVAHRLESLQDNYHFQSLQSWPIHLDLDHIDFSSKLLGITQYSVTRR